MNIGGTLSYQSRVVVVLAVEVLLGDVRDPAVATALREGVLGNVDVADSVRGAEERAPAEVEVVEEAAAPGSKQGEKIKAEIDDLLDEIDEVLEENAEDFVRSYVQKGGQ